MLLTHNAAHKAMMEDDSFELPSGFVLLGLGIISGLIPLFIIAAAIGLF
ncbi:MAG: hypothetical protein HQL45_08170 [Alphaproteobacteria bacterium]|nr:hypothetical protein [Alphaproteobacteria bacterium]